MIKLGDAYFDETRIIAIQPYETHGAESLVMSCYCVHIAGGGLYKWIADANEVQRRLEEVGLIAPLSTPMPDFTEDELAELAACLAVGYSYVAKDENGRVYAFDEYPAKGKTSWINNDERSRIFGLVAGRYAALSFEDECPMNIAVALEGVQRC